MEKWKDIKGYEGLYQVSNLGRIKSFQKEPEGRIMHVSWGNWADYHVVLSKNGRQRGFSVHRLVAQAFVPNPHPRKFTIVYARDGDRTNCRADNLYWGSK